MRSRGEGSIRKRRTGIWEARVSINGRQVSFYHATKTGAMAKARQARADAERGAAVLLPTVTVAAYLAAWLDQTVRPGARPATYTAYAYDCRQHIVPAIGAIRLAHLTPAHVETMLSGMAAAGYADKTISHVRGVLSVALSAAQRDYGLARNVAKLAALPRTSAPPFAPERLSVADVRAVMDAVRGDRIEPAVLFSIATGVRHGELRGLSRDDIDGRVVTIRHAATRKAPHRLVRPKGKPRVLALPDLAVHALALEAEHRATDRELAGTRWTPSPIVFARRHGGIQPVVTAGRALRRCTDAAGLPPVRWHALRRMFAAVLLDKGVPLLRIRDLLGHSHVAVTEHYAYPMDEALAADMGAIDDGLGYN